MNPSLTLYSLHRKHYIACRRTQSHHIVCHLAFGALVTDRINLHLAFPQAIQAAGCTYLGLCYHPNPQSGSL